MLVFGPEVDRSGGWDVGVAFAEKVRRRVYIAPLPDRVSFPGNHPLYRGELPMTIAGANEVMRGHDVVMVIGAKCSATTRVWQETTCQKGPNCCKSRRTPTSPEPHRSAKASWATPVWR